MLSTTLMFVFSSGVVNYDNLTNLLSISAIFFFIKFYQSFNIKDLIRLLIIVLLGILTKLTFLPLTLILFVLTLFIIYKNRKGIKDELICFIKQTHPITKVVYLILIIVLFLLVGGLYGRNILKYGSYQPRCDVVASHEECYQYSYSYKVYYDGFIADTDTNHPSVNLISDFTGWGKFNLQTIYGTLTHRGVFFRMMSIIPFAILLVASLIKAVQIIFKEKKVKPEVVLLFAIFMAYASFLYYYNYNEYLNSGVWNGMQGRYLFPVWPLIYIIIAEYLLSFKRKSINYAILVTFFFVSFITSFGIYYFRKPADYQMDWHKIEYYEEFYNNLE